MIEVKNLVKDYGKHHAVKDISFSVPDRSWDFLDQMAQVNPQQ